MILVIPPKLYACLIRNYNSLNKLEDLTQNG